MTDNEKSKSERIDDIISGVMKIAHGDIDHQFKISDKNDKIDALSMGINMLMDDIKEGHLQKIENERIIKLNQELIEAKEKALESERLKNQFLQNISHEIRTPLNAIIGFSELLPTYFDDKERLIEFTEIINNSSVDLLQIINDILDIAKIESGQVAINWEIVNIKTMLNNIEVFFSEYQKQLHKSHIEFIMNFPCDNVTKQIQFDSGKLKQILTNLLSNAFKFTNTGKIEVGYKGLSDTHITMYVSDTGIGISRELQAQIFDRFIQAEDNYTQKQKGTGLGLSIVKGLIELLGGNIWLESELNKGSTFTFSIPYKYYEPDLIS